MKKVQVRKRLDRYANGLWPTAAQVQTLRAQLEASPVSEKQMTLIATQLGFRPTQQEMLCVRLLAAFILDCQVLKALMALADQKSQEARQVAHGHPHAVDVSHLTLSILNRVEELIPGTVSDLDRAVGVVSGALHDTGRLEDIKRHAAFSAIIADWYLPKLAASMGMTCPDWFRKLAVHDCVKHQSSAVLYRSDAEKRLGKREIKHAHHAALLTADKLCGSEARVVPDKMDLLERLKKLSLPKAQRERFGLDPHWSLARLCWNRPEAETADAKVVAAAEKVLKRKKISIEGVSVDHHDHMNGAIRDRQIEFFLDTERDGSQFRGTMLYRLTVDVRIAPSDLLTELDWWDDALHTAAKAAKYLGFRFQLEFNGQTMIYSKPDAKLIAVEPTHI